MEEEAVMENPGAVEEPQSTMEPSGDDTHDEGVVNAEAMEGDPQPAPESEAGQGETHAPEETQDGGEEENKDVDDASGEGKAAGEQTDVPEGNAEEAGDEEAERGEERGDQEEASTTNSDELSVMKSGAKDKISVMCVDVKSGANDMYLVAPDAVVWDAVGQFVKSKNIDPDSIVVRYHGQPVEVDKPFHMYSIKPGDAIELSLYQGGLPEGTEVEETDTGDENRQILEVEIPPGIDARTGTVVGHGRMVQVLVDWSQMERKKFLGGWRSKKTGAVYHNATSQTKRQPRFTEEDRKLTRETQTVDTRTLRSQTYRECSTQCDRPNLELREDTDRVIVPYERGPYQTAEELWAIKAEKALVIQTFWRSHVARTEVARRRKERDQERRRLRAEAEEAARKEEAARQREIMRRVQPRTAEDFATLKSELETWRVAQTMNITDMDMEPHDRHSELEQLLYKETKLLQTIDRLQLVAQDVRRERTVDRQLKAMAAPKEWSLTNGDTAQVHTPFTIRARELMHLYQGLTLPKPTTQERLDVLLHVKYTVKEFDCALTREMVQLIDREADLLNRGRLPKTLHGLRRRLANLFLAFIGTPEFNPEASRFAVTAAGSAGLTGPIKKSAEDTVPTRGGSRTVTP